MRPIIKVDNLSKKYRIGARQAAYKTIRESLVETIRAPFARLRRTEETEETTLWALKDVNLEIMPGEVVGIIGHNGAGKSTLLKIISRITEPTTGQVDIYGRVGSLLEVGTGFHAELTGRENVYLSGAILGMSKSEIERKFSRIVEFAEIDRFLDTQVKHYSSGMYVRLAFSVAIHLEPQILLVDEVLAVGDLSFQQKCLAQMNYLRSSGMTIVLVSHNMAAIQSICQSAIYLMRGQVEAIGRPLEIIEKYRNSLQRKNGSAPEEVIATKDMQQSSSGITIVNFEMFGEDGRETREVRFGESIKIRITVQADQRLDSPMINFGIQRGDGITICNFNNWYDNFKVDYLEGECVMEGWLPPIRLIPDFYTIHALVWKWGGGHLDGDMSDSAPVAWKTFGAFRVYGVGLNSHDGVMQFPANKWKFHRNGTSFESCDISPDITNEISQIYQQSDKNAG